MAANQASESDMSPEILNPAYDPRIIASEKPLNDYFEQLGYPDIHALSISTPPRIVQPAFAEELSSNEPYGLFYYSTHLGNMLNLGVPIYMEEVYADKERLLHHLQNAMRMGRELGAKSVSFTGTIPSATRYCADIQARIGAEEQLTGEPNPLRVTSGHATTLGCVNLNIQNALAVTGRCIENETIASLGVGSVGRGVIELLLKASPHPDKLILCDVAQKKDALAALQCRLKQEFGFNGPIEVAIAEQTLPSAFYHATCVIGATNNVDIIDVDRLRSGTIIVDDSAPHCFNETDAIKRATLKHDILFIEGGVVELPFPIGEVKKQIRQDAEITLPTIISDRPPSYITSCILGSILLSRFEELGATVGLVDIHQAVAYFDKLKALGITGCIHFDRYFSGMVKALPPDRVERFIETTRKKHP